MNNMKKILFFISQLASLGESSKILFNALDRSLSLRITGRMIRSHRNHVEAVAHLKFLHFLRGSDCCPVISNKFSFLSTCLFESHIQIENYSFSIKVILKERYGLKRVGLTDDNIQMSRVQLCMQIRWFLHGKPAGAVMGDDKSLAGIVGDAREQMEKGGLPLGLACSRFTNIRNIH